MLVDAVGRENEYIAHVDRKRATVDLDLRIHPESAAQLALPGRAIDTMFIGQLLERPSGDAADTRVADLEQVQRRRLEDGSAERADITPIAVVREAAAPCLGMKPGIRRGQNTLCRRFN